MGVYILVLWAVTKSLVSEDDTDVRWQTIELRLLFAPGSSGTKAQEHGPLGDKEELDRHGAPV